MITIVLRGGAVVDDPLERALRFLERYGAPEAESMCDFFGEHDLRKANQGGARISAAEIAAIVERRAEIECALRAIPVRASLTQPAGSVRWTALMRLFDAFADIRGVGFSKMTKALHPKRPALIPMLDSVVQRYLIGDCSGVRAAKPFGRCATDLVRSYKVDLDCNRLALRELKRELASRRYPVTEVRLLDLLIWSASATT